MISAKIVTDRANETGKCWSKNLSFLQEKWWIYWKSDLVSRISLSSVTECHARTRKTVLSSEKEMTIFLKFSPKNSFEAFNVDVYVDDVNRNVLCLRVNPRRLEFLIFLWICVSYQMKNCKNLILKLEKLIKV